MSTAVLESSAASDSVVADEPILGEAFTAMLVSGFAGESVTAEFAYTSPPQFGWATVAGMAEPSDLLSKSYYYESYRRNREKGPEELARLLRAAVSRLETVGWVQGSFRDAWGRVCAFGALREVGATDWDLEMINQVACEVLVGRGTVDRFSGQPYQSVPRWNDAPGRVAGEVAGLLRATAEAYDAKVVEDGGCPCPMCGSRAPVVPALAYA